MRTFIAISLPKTVQGYLAILQQRLQNTGADVKWVQPQNIHLTLKFLGEVDEVKLEKISQIIEAVAKENPEFSIALTCPGAFPKITSPRVIWMGFGIGGPEAKIIAKALEEKIQKLGIPREERAFSAHLTLGRTRSGNNLQNLVQALIEEENNTDREKLQFRAKEITLYKSTLTPQGPIYDILKQASLKAI